MLRGGEELRKFGQKKRARATNPNRWSNNIQLLTNNVATNEFFILSKLFQPKSKCINLAFLIANLL